MRLQKDSDATLPASHIMTLNFVLARNGVVKGIRSISMPEMRADGAPIGDALDGVSVSITATDFRVGLDQGPSSSRAISRRSEAATGSTFCFFSTTAKPPR